MTLGCRYHTVPLEERPVIGRALRVFRGFESTAESGTAKSVDVDRRYATFAYAEDRVESLVTRRCGVHRIRDARVVAQPRPAAPRGS